MEDTEANESSSVPAIPPRPIRQSFDIERAPEIPQVPARPTKRPEKLVMEHAFPADIPPIPQRPIRRVSTEPVEPPPPPHPTKTT